MLIGELKEGQHCGVAARNLSLGIFSDKVRISE